MLTHLDLCTGIGGFHLAAEWAGFQTIGFAEIEPYCCNLLAQKWPHIKNYGDIRTADFRGLRGRVSVLSAGVPCQPTSLAGKRRGSKDDRWLWPPVLNVVRDVKPAWAIFENPPGIAEFHSFNEILLRLGNLEYAIRLFNVPAEAVGANFIGYRCFIIAAATSLRGGSWPLSREYEATQRRTSGEPVGCLRWEAEPRVSRVANGFSEGKHYLRALGNAVVPQQAYPFFEAIKALMTSCSTNAERS